MGILSVRLDEDLEKRIEFLLKQKKIVDKSAFIRQLLDKSTREELINFLSEEVKERRMSAWKASEVAHISLRAMLFELSKRKVSIYNERALAEDIEFIRKNWNDSNH